MIGAEDLQQRLACLGTDVPCMEDPVLLLVGDTPDGGEEITPEHQVVEDISLVIRGVLPPDGVEILRVGARYILHQHIKLPRLPSIQEEASSAPDCDGSGHVLGALEDHRLENYEYISVPASLLESCEFYGHHPYKFLTDSPDQRIVAPHGHDRQCLPHLIPSFAVGFPRTEVCSIVGVNPVSIHHLNLQVLPGGHIIIQIPL